MEEPVLRQKSDPFSIASLLHLAQDTLSRLHHINHTAPLLPLSVPSTTVRPHLHQQCTLWMAFEIVKENAKERETESESEIERWNENGSANVDVHSSASESENLQSIVSASANGNVLPFLLCPSVAANGKIVRSRTRKVRLKRTGQDSMKLAAVMLRLSSIFPPSDAMDWRGSAHHYSQLLFVSSDKIVTECPLADLPDLAQLWHPSHLLQLQSVVRKRFAVPTTPTSPARLLITLLL